MVHSVAQEGSDVPGERAERLSAARKQAWATRRANYGPQGHRGYAPRQSSGGALRLVIQLHAEGVLSEGQVSQATGLDRVEIRRRREAVEEMAAFAALAVRQATPALESPSPGTSESE